MMKDTDDSHNDGDSIAQQHRARHDQRDDQQNDPGKDHRGHVDPKEEGPLHAGADGDHAQERQRHRNETRRRVVGGTGRRFFWEDHQRQKGKQQARQDGVQWEQVEEPHRADTSLQRAAEGHQYPGTDQQLGHVTVDEAVGQELVNCNEEG